jgi:hypothetical protein
MLKLFSRAVGGGGGGGGGVVQQGARDATAQEWLVKFLTPQQVTFPSPQQVTLPNVEVAPNGVMTNALPIAGADATFPATARVPTVRNIAGINQLSAYVENVVTTQERRRGNILNVFGAARVDAAGATAAQTLLSLFNPTTTGKDAFLLGVYVSSYSVAASAVTVSLRLARIWDASGGLLLTSALISKWDSQFIGDPFCEVRINNPTISVASDVVAFPPNQNITAAGTTATQIHQFLPMLFAPYGLERDFRLRPGEGVALYFAAGQDTDQRWNATVVWAESV